MKRAFLMTLLCLMFLTLSVLAADTEHKATGQTLATTGKIAAIDFAAKVFKVRSGEGAALQNFSPKITVEIGGIALPGGVSIQIPGRTPKSSKSTSNRSTSMSISEYSVVISDKTVLQDGIDTIQLEDFKVGESISIHGVLNGQTLTATRIAKWPVDGSSTH